MRSAFLIAALLAVIVVALAQDPFEGLQQHSQACANKLSDESMLRLKEGHTITYPEMGCFVACLYTKAGLMNRAKMNIQKIEKQVTESDDPEQGMHIIEKLKQCQAYAEKTSDECKVGERYATCMKSRLGGKE